MPDVVKKRFPADTRMEVLTFLNDKKVDGELYALLQVSSYPEKIDGQTITVVRKKNLPTKKDMCKTLGLGSPKTLNNHLNYLIERGFVQKLGDNDYILPDVEDMYLLVPSITAQYLKDTVQEQVIKIFIYLGQRWNYKKLYMFTLKEIAQHIGLKLEGSPENASKINNSLDLLSKLGLISYVEFYDKGKPCKRLTNFSLFIPS